MVHLTDPVVVVHLLCLILSIQGPAQSVPVLVLRRHLSPNWPITCRVRRQTLLDYLLTIRSLRFVEDVLRRRGTSGRKSAAMTSCHSRMSWRHKDCVTLQVSRGRRRTCLQCRAAECRWHGGGNGRLHRSPESTEMWLPRTWTGHTVAMLWTEDRSRLLLLHSSVYTASLEHRSDAVPACLLWE